MRATPRHTSPAIAFLAFLLASFIFAPAAAAGSESSAAGGGQQAQMSAAPPSSLDRGYLFAYNLDFASAQHEFSHWQRQHPDDPVGPVSEAAGLLFAEFNRLGILETRLFEKDSAFSSRKKLRPDPAVRDRFHSALQRADTLAQQRLASHPDDQDALFAQTLSAGLKADYAALVEKRNLASLGYTRDATTAASKLLKIAPTYYDAYLASGLGKYIIGSLAAPFRWLLHLGGFSGDKKGGMGELQLTAQHGRYLAPFARLLLAVAYLREKDSKRARELLAGLRDEFPANPLFSREIARLDQRQSGQ